MERRLSRRACTERECHTYTDTWSVCVCGCVYVSQRKRENHPVPQEGGWEIEWPYIHKDVVCVCVCGKRENHPVPQGEGGGGGGGFSFLPGPHAQLENHTTAWVGGGDAGGSRAQNRGCGARRCRRSRGISCSTPGGGGRIHHDVHYLLKYKSTLQDTMRGGGGGGGGGPAGAQPYIGEILEGILHGVLSARRYGLPYETAKGAMPIGCFFWLLFYVPDFRHEIPYITQ